MKKPVAIKDTYFGLPYTAGTKVHGRKLESTSPQPPTHFQDRMYTDRNWNSYGWLERNRYTTSRCGLILYSWVKWGEIAKEGPFVHGLCQHCFPGTEHITFDAPWRPVEYGYNMTQRGAVTRHILNSNGGALCGHYYFAKIRLPWLEKAIRKFVGVVPLCGNCERIDLAVEGSLYRELYRRT